MSLHRRCRFAINRQLLLINILVVAQLLHQHVVRAACPSVGGSMSLSGACTLANLQSQGCDPTTLGISASDVQQICADAAVTFGSITNNNYQFDKSYMDGGGRWNTGQDGIPNSVSLKADAGRVGRVAATVAAGAPIAWPVYTALNNFTDPTFEDGRRLASLSTTDTDASPESYISNFNLSDTTCELNTVMCCFIKNRLSSFSGNANVCNMNLAEAPHSNRVWDGYGTYDSSTPAYCVGFTWSPTATDASNRFKGNALFDVAYSFSTLQKGYVENIPGAPMCGCLEQMPAVTRADCRQVNVNKEAYVVTRPSSNELVVSPDLTKTSITYSACATDLATASQTIWKTNAAKTLKIKSQLVGAGQCPTVNAKFLNEQFWVPGDVSAYTTKPDPSQWTQVAGYGTYFFPVRDSLTVQDANFRALVGTSAPYALILRVCPSCLPSHRQIFYKRLTAIPPASSGFNFLNLFLDDFTTRNSTSNPNVLGRDYQLYSTYQDAVSGKNPWKYCYSEKNEDIGFPASCGPVTYTDCQWNKYTDDMCDTDYNGWLHGFFVQKK